MICKLCFVLQNSLAREPAGAFPLHPSGHGLFQGIEPVSEPSNPYRRIEPLAGDFALPAPVDVGGVPAPKPPDNFIEAMSWGRFHREQRVFLPLCNPDQEGSFRAALPWNLSIDQ